MSELGVTIEELVRTLKARRVRVPAEIGTFVALECAERLLEGPALVTMGDVRLSEDGLVSLFVAPGSASPQASAQSLVSMLAGLLVAAGTAVPTPLIGIVESGGPTGPEALADLRSMLEAALVPLNRQAARRVLSRMIREARRPATERPPAASSGGLDDAIDALLDGAATAPYPSSFDPDVAPRSEPPRARPPSPSTPPPAAIPAPAPPPTAPPALASLEEPPSLEPAPPRPAPAPARPAPARPAPAPAAPRAREGEREEEPARRKPRPIELADDVPAPSRGGTVWFVLATLIAAGAIGALFFARERPELVDQLLGRPSADQLPDAAVPPPAPVNAGTLEVTSTPAEAQVFLFVGRGPTVVDELPTGVAHEFLVLADGRLPQRAIVLPDATWEPDAEGQRRYELAAQAGAALAEGASPNAVDLGPSLMPREPGTPGELGSVRVITNPPGAKVYMLIGFTPDVHVENLPTEGALELIVWSEGHQLERLVVGPSDWQGEGSEQTARVTATLTELPRRR